MTVSTDNGSTTKRIAVLVENGFEDSEFQVPYTALKRAGAEVVVLGSRMNQQYRGKRNRVTIQPDATTTEVLSDDFDAILIPGGQAPDHIRMNDRAVQMVMDAMAQGKLIAAVCHGPQVLIEADQLRGKQATGFRAIRKDIQNAGATYVDEPVVVDENLITARRPGDLPLFTTTLLSYLGLTINGETLPDAATEDYEWWQLGEHWGGSTKQDIINVINTALVGERYTLAAFRQYVEKLADSNDPEMQYVFANAIAVKEQHVESLEIRLRQLGEQVSWQAVGSEAFATLQNWLQSSNDKSDLLRRALGDLQTGAVDATHFSAQLTDPKTSDILDRIARNLTQLEERIGDLYRARSGRNVQPPMPTTISVG